MVTPGIDAHKRTHTVVAVDDVGREMGTKTTTATTTAEHLELLRWAERFEGERAWAVYAAARPATYPSAVAASPPRTDSAT